MVVHTLHTSKLEEVVSKLKEKYIIENNTFSLEDLIKNIRETVGNIYIKIPSPEKYNGIPLPDVFIYMENIGTYLFIEYKSTENLCISALCQFLSQGLSHLVAPPYRDIDTTIGLLVLRDYVGVLLRCERVEDFIHVDMYFNRNTKKLEKYKYLKKRIKRDIDRSYIHVVFMFPEKLLMERYGSPDNIYVFISWINNISESIALLLRYEQYNKKSFLPFIYMV